MLDLYQEINKKLHLSFGEMQLSPLTALSVSLVFEHIENFPTVQQRRPLFMSFPTKEGIVALLPAIVLINLFFEDYIYRSDQIEQDLALKRGDLIEIFQTAAVFNKMDADTLELSFSDGGQYKFNRRYVNFIHKTKKKQPNTHKLFNEKRSRFLRNPDSLSRILEPNGKMTVPKASLKSKLMIVAGRGNMGKIKHSLSTYKIFDEPLDGILSGNGNLIIKQDLEEFIGLASGQDEKAEQKFFTFFSLVVSRLSEEELEDCQGLDEIRSSIANGRTTHTDFRELFADFLDGLDHEGDLFNRFSALTKHLPVADNSLPADLKAIFICEVKLYESYEHTIAYFIKKGIPVICLVDKLIETKEELDFFSQFFASRPDSIRLNWSREIISLIEVDNGQTRYLDQQFWSFAKRYAHQRVELKVYDDNGLEEIFDAASAVIAQLDGHEILINSFRKWLFPAWYIVKNSFGANLPPLSLLDAFDNAISASLHTVPRELRELSSALRDFTFNQKQAGCSHLYVQQVLVPDKGMFTIPAGTFYMPVPTDEKFASAICFSGFPYKEPSHRPLWRAVFETLVPVVHIALWSKEGQLTHSYLRSRIVKSEMPANLDLGSKLQERIFTVDVGSAASGERIFYSVPETHQAELPLDFLAEKLETDHSHARYIGTSQQGYQLACNILYFEQEVMYVPHQGKLYRLMDDGYGNFRLKIAGFDELSKGSQIVLFNLTRHDIRTYAKSDPRHQGNFELVDTWRELLWHAFEQNDGDLSKLLSSMEDLSRVKDGMGSPTRHNLQRWLYDDDMIAPESDNLSLIFLCAGEKGETADITSIAEAARTLRSASKSISSEVKRHVLQSINSRGEMPDSFVQVHGISVKVVLREIIGLEKSDVLVNYLDTRKILS
ncbi:hypothetical protein OQZ33_17255 [Pedobacter sp. MC2016-05]|uniref:hypothetical protein n=1 Tax=Pedobacter sp. MC2016-05 TaxID=2994474 RepID=UPI002246B1C7|nr:hypothetical protein [Pedobacter sp. MC2016-05]MCX2476085.1 hypothetical protein [Pedobacter sp. MC2016-05]